MKRNIKIAAEACSLQTGIIIEIFLNFLEGTSIVGFA